MKVTYLERVERHNAWSRKMYCPFCGAHEYEIVEQLEPKTLSPWFVRCPQCENSSYESPTRDIAIGRWRSV